MCFASIYLKYPKLENVVKFDFPERKKYQENFLRINFQKLIESKYFDSYELIGSKRNPRGIKTKLTLASTLKLKKKTFIGNIFIDKLDGAKKKLNKPLLAFFCVKMTVSIQIEGFKEGMQSCEDRYVLIKAKNPEDAYNKVEKQEKDYAKPYLNSDLRLVSWKIESYDDCYETFIDNINDFNKPEGVEVYSKLRSRKLTKERAWSKNSYQGIKVK